MMTHCDDCACVNPVWYAPNALWNLVMGGPEAKGDPGGMICPVCFIKRAEASGGVPTGWKLLPETDDDLEDQRRIAALTRDLEEAHKDRVKANNQWRLDYNEMAGNAEAHTEKLEAALSSLKREVLEIVARTGPQPDVRYDLAGADAHMWRNTHWQEAQEAIYAALQQHLSSGVCPMSERETPHEQLQRLIPKFTPEQLAQYWADVILHGTAHVLESNDGTVRVVPYEEARAMIPHVSSTAPADNGEET